MSYYISPSLSDLLNSVWQSLGPPTLLQMTLFHSFSVSQSFQSLSHVQLFAIPWLQHARLLCPSYLLEFLQIHVHWVSDAIQPSRSLPSPSPPAFSLSQHQGLFQWVSSSHLVAKVLELQLEHESFQWKFRVDFLQGWLIWSPCSPKDSQESSPTPQFRSINSSTLSFLYGPTLTSLHDY